MGLAALALLGWATTTVHADAQQEAPFVFSDCAEAPLGEEPLRRALHLEQAGTALDTDLRLLEVRYACSGRVLARIAGPEGDRIFRLTVHDVPPAERVRALALALAELTRDVDSPAGSLDPQGTDVDPAAPTADAADARRDEADAAGAAEPAASWIDESDYVEARDEPSSDEQGRPATRGALAAFAARVPLPSRTILVGATATYQHGPWSWSGSVLTARARARHQERSLGTVSALLGGAHLGYLLWSLDFAPLRLELELTGGVGLVRLWATGHTNVSARGVVRPYVEGRFGARLLGGPRGQTVPFLELHAGRSSGLVGEAEGREVLRTGGWLAGGAVGVAF